MIDIKPHVKVIQHPNPTRRTIHVTREVVDGAEKFGWGDSVYRHHKVKPSENALLLRDRLSAVSGVIGGTFGNYELDVAIGDAFDWSEIGPVVLGEIVNTLFPETFGKTIEISVTIGWAYQTRSRRMYDDDDDGHRTRYQDMASRVVVEVTDPQILDLERFLDGAALQKAKSMAVV